LLANNDASEFSAGFANDARKVCALLQTQKPEWIFTIYSVKDDNFPQAEDADGYVITGSPASVHDDLPWIRKLEHFIQQLDDDRIPLIGLCFGHQLIAKALGGRVSENPGGWRFGVAATQFSVSRSWMDPPASQLLLHACHSEQVTQLPPGATLLGGDEFCPVGSFAIDSHVFTTEYHPEFTTSFMQALADAYEGEVPARVLDVGREELRTEVQSELFARWMVNFLEELA